MNSIEKYNYNLPLERIAKFPADPRDASKLLIYRNKNINRDVFYNIHKYLPENSLLIINNSKVIPARIHFFNKNGAKIEVFCLNPVEPNNYAEAFDSITPVKWQTLIKNKRRWKQEKLILKKNNLILQAELHPNNIVKFRWEPEMKFSEVLEIVGETPLPPYLKRESTEKDKQTYQTIYAKNPGSVAAPTAGLHFTHRTINSLKQKNIQIAEVSLHVGIGTFKPITSDDFTKHQMHSELVSITKNTLQKLLQNIKGKNPVIAVGTTSARTLESLPFLAYNIAKQNKYSVEQNATTFYKTEQALEFLLSLPVETINFSTSLFIYPPYEFKIVEGLITNFHLPKSSLLLLVDAFVGGAWREIYEYALQNDFRFLSYGDSSLLFRE